MIETAINNSTPKTRVQFPGQKDVLRKLIDDYLNEGFQIDKSGEELTLLLLKKFEECQKANDHFIDSGAKQKPFNEKEEDMIASNFALLPKPDANEFYTIAAPFHSEEIFPDDRITKLLGIPLTGFSTLGSVRQGPNHFVALPEDLNHSSRFDFIAKLVYSLSWFDVIANRDHYMTQFRINTSMSQINSIRNLEYVTVEKKCYPFFDNEVQVNRGPIYYINKYSIYTDLEMDYIAKTFVSGEKQSIYMNAFTYLLNLHLVGIPPKYILMLDERQLHDRNKSVASSMQLKINNDGNRSIEFDEHKIADCFAKTIRHRVSEAFNCHEKRKNGHRINIKSDAESVHYAKKIGLLPIPARVKKIMYDLIT